MEKYNFLILLVARNFGVVNAASEDIQNREEKITDGQSKKEVARSGWSERAGVKCESQQKQ